VKAGGWAARDAAWLLLGVLVLAGAIAFTVAGRLPRRAEVPGAPAPPPPLDFATSSRGAEARPARTAGVLGHRLAITIVNRGARRRGCRCRVTSTPSRPRVLAPASRAPTRCCWTCPARTSRGCSTAGRPRSSSSRLAPRGGPPVMAARTPFRPGRALIVAREEYAGAREPLAVRLRALFAVFVLGLSFFGLAQSGEVVHRLRARDAVAAEPGAVRRAARRAAARSHERHGQRRFAVAAARASRSRAPRCWRASSRASLRRSPSRNCSAWAAAGSSWRSTPARPPRRLRGALRRFARAGRAQRRDGARDRLDLAGPPARDRRRPGAVLVMVVAYDLAVLGITRRSAASGCSRSCCPPCC